MATSNTQTRFDNNFTRKFGFPKERPAGKVVESLRQSHMDFISQSPFCVMATADLAGSCDASPKGGLPGFVKILDERHLLFPDVAGINETVRVNGTASIVSGEQLKKMEIALEVRNPDENAKVLQGLLVEVEESYGHCPRAFSFANLWDTNQINSNRGIPKKLND